MPQAAANSEIQYYSDGVLSLQWGKETLKVRASFTQNGNGGTFTGIVDDGPTKLINRSVTVMSPDLINAYVCFKRRRH
jgi:hypothetical protein